MTTVGVIRTGRAGYSEDWKEAENFAEKDALRELSRLLGFPRGNLFRDLIHPGDRVVIKPNWVEDRHAHGGGITQIVTHSSVLRAVVDLVYEALDGRGSITLADAPVWGCDFRRLMSLTEAEAIPAYYRKTHGFDIPIRDLRQMAKRSDAETVKSADRTRLPGDPEGYAVVDLKEKSAFGDMPHAERLYGDDYDRQETIQHHNGERHEYLVSKTILGSDVVVSVPKLKTHAKVGATLNAKGMVGINGNKNWVAHYRLGPPAAGGDEFPDAEKRAAKAKTSAVHTLRDRLLARRTPLSEHLYDLIVKSFRLARPLLFGLGKAGRTVGSGEWYGNDTAWRMTADLARIVQYADHEGMVHAEPQRRFCSVIDGIVGGQGDGPLAPDPVPAGVLLASSNLLAADLVASRLMGFDWRKIRYLQWLVDHGGPWTEIVDPTSDIDIASNVPEWGALLCDPACPDLGFAPAPGWRGHLEIRPPAYGQGTPA